MTDAKNYILTLTVQTPVFIGSGAAAEKKEYIARAGRIYFPDPEKLAQWVIDHRCENDFQRLMFDRNGNLTQFFDSRRSSTEEIKKISAYSVEGSARNGRDTINLFVKNSSGDPYIPGSSLKGALRTVILTKLISGGAIPIDIRDGRPDPDTKNIEAEYLNILGRVRRRNDALNDVMSSLLISDSSTLSADSLTICRKCDAAVSGEVHYVNTARESLCPGTVAKFMLTLKDSGTFLTADFLKQAIAEYGEFYEKTYVKRFRRPVDAVGEGLSNCILLGGGCGYFSKNIIYPAMGRSEAVSCAAKIMAKKFQKHHHENDTSRDIGISPRMLKYTKIRDARGREVMRQTGICRLELKRL